MLGRLVVSAAIVLAALLPPSALGFAPGMMVTTEDSKDRTTIELGDPDGATAGVVVYAPPGFSATLDQAPGERVGTVPAATVSTAGLHVSLKGELKATDPALGTPRSCTPGPHAASLLLELHAPGLDVSFPVDLDRAQGIEAGYASYRLHLCPSDAPATRLVALRLVLDGLFAAPAAPARHVWRGVFTPFSAEGVPDPAASVESRSILPLPVRLDLAASYDPLAVAVALRGSLSSGGQAVAGQRVRLFAGPNAWPRRSSGEVTTGAQGRFRASRPIRTRTTFRATATLPAQDVTASECGEPVAPGGCIRAVVAPQEAESRAVRVRAPAPLQYGSRGALVRTLQQTLVRLKYLAAGAPRGTFDENTWHAVVAFQGWQGFVRDGVVTKAIWRALGRAGPPRPWGGMKLRPPGRHGAAGAPPRGAATGRAGDPRLDRRRRRDAARTVRRLPQGGDVVVGAVRDLDALRQLLLRRLRPARLLERPGVPGLPRLHPRTADRGAGRLRLRGLRQAGLGPLTARHPALIP